MCACAGKGWEGAWRPGRITGGAGEGEGRRKRFFLHAGDPPVLQVFLRPPQINSRAQQSTASRAHSSHTLSPSRRANNPPPFCALPLLLVSRLPAPYDLIDRQPVVIANMLVGGSLGSSLQRVPHCRGVTPRCICRASPLCTTRARNGWTRQRRNERLRPMSAVTPSSPVPYPTR